MSRPPESSVDRLAVVVQRYGLEINGGAEYHARLIAEKLSAHFQVEVFSSTALDYLTWAPHYPAGTDLINGVKVNRFDVARRRDPERFGRLQEKIFNQEHSAAEELLWLEENGPFLPGLITELQARQDEFRRILFFSYRYYHSWAGIQAMPQKALLVPTAEHDQVIYMHLFKELFHLPAAIAYNSVEEKELINRVSGNHHVPGDIIGVGSEVLQPAPLDLQGLFGLRRPFLLYIGRLDENKGVPELLTHFQRLQAEEELELDLVLVGKAWIEVPEHPAIRHLGFLSDEQKYTLLQAAEFLVVPSQFESLSMVTLEAWALGRAVLVNGRTEVLAGQCRRSRAGLWYQDYDQFREGVLTLLADPELRRRLGENGRDFFRANYSWPVIIDKYLRLLG